MDNQLLQEDFEDFFENSLCGYVTTNLKGEIIRCNTRLAEWLCYDKEDLKGKRFSSLLAIGGRMYYETHLAPLMRLQGFFDEIELELVSKNGERLHFLVNGYERHDAQKAPLFIRLTIFKASERHIYEENLRHAKAIAEDNLSAERQMAILREQFIAVLGHDLRNPLSGIAGGATMLLDTASNQQTSAIARMIKRSASRIAELVENIMDFARTRLGGGMHIEKQLTELEPVLIHVVEELRLGWASREIETHFSVTSPVYCDSARISQLLSNLLANALVHGLPNGVVHVHAHTIEDSFEMSVSNIGNPIPEENIKTLFEPFKRERTSPSKQGLGLGLYISSEIARTHGGTLTVVSSKQETRFTFRMLRLENNS